MMFRLSYASLATLSLAVLSSAAPLAAREDSTDVEDINFGKIIGKVIPFLGGGSGTQSSRAVPTAGPNDVEDINFGKIIGKVIPFLGGSGSQQSSRAEPTAGPNDVEDINFGKIIGKVIPFLGGGGSGTQQSSRAEATEHPLDALVRRELEEYLKREGATDVEDINFGKVFGKVLPFLGGSGTQQSSRAEATAGSTDVEDINFGKIIGKVIPFLGGSGSQSSRAEPTSLNALD